MVYSPAASLAMVGEPDPKNVALTVIPSLAKLIHLIEAEAGKAARVSMRLTYCASVGVSPVLK